MRKITPSKTAPVTSRSLALHILLEIVQQRRSLDEVLPGLYESTLNASDKAFARQLVMSTLRHHGQLATLLQSYLKKPLTAKLRPVDWLLRLGVGQLVLLHVPAHAAIDTSVALCKALGFRHQAGLVNAVLRTIVRDGPVLPPARHNVPGWLLPRWRCSYPEAFAAIAEQCAAEPPTDLQFKPGISMGKSALLPNSQRVVNQDVTQLAGYGEGSFWVQDVAASLPVRLLGDVNGLRVLDLCAAPGGKTLQLCAAGARVMAVDRSQQRMQRLHENLARCQMDAEMAIADIASWWPPVPPEAVLFDAPCSATGTIRRHPDLFLRKTEQDIHEMVALQRRLLGQIMRWLPANVPLVYCVCSLEPEEGESQLQWLLDTYPECSLQSIDHTSIEHELPGRPAKGGGWRTLPSDWAELGGMDGFFMARLIKA